MTLPQFHSQRKNLDPVAGRARTDALKVLLIENNEKDRRLISNYLVPDAHHEMEYLLEVRENLTEGLERIKQGGIDIILLDIALPESHGIEAFAFVCEEAPNIPIIILTGLDDAQLARLILQKGAQDYLVKDSINAQLLKRSLDYGCERKRLLMKLEEASERRFKNIIDRNLDAMVILSADDTILFVNAAAETLFGETQKSLIGKKFAYPHTLDETHQIEIPQRSGRVIIGEIRVTPIDWENKTDKLATIRDVTESQKVEKLKSQINEFERVSKLKDQFLGTVSHELRTPLTIIRGAVGNMIDGIAGALSEPQQKLVRIAESNVARLSRIIDDLLDLSRLESERVRINPRQIDMAPFVDRIIQSFQIVAAEGHLTLVEEIPEKVPHLFADPDMLTQVMNNLLINAMRYAKSKVTIRIQKAKSLPKIVDEEEDLIVNNTKKPEGTEPARTAGEFVQISVIDDGPGIPKDQMPDLFSKFVQINRPIGGAGYKGTGLGLAICKAIIDQHQGKIWAKSKLEQGTQFHVLLSHYDESKIFFAHIQDALSVADKNQSQLCIILCFVTNIEELYETADYGAVQEMFENTQRKIQINHLRKTEKIMFYPNRGVIMTIVHEDKIGGEIFRAKIAEILDQMVCAGRQGEIKAIVSVGMTFYPNDAKIPIDLLNIAYKNSQKRRVLIIDDEQSILDMIAVLLRVREYLVETAVDGLTGINLAHSFRPDVIVLDIMMPDLNGWDVCRRLRADPRTKDISIIILTASVEKDLQNKARDFNVTVMSKPYNPKELLEMLKKESQLREGEFRF